MALAENGSRTQRNCAPAVLIGFQPNILEKAVTVNYFAVKMEKNMTCAFTNYHNKQILITLNTKELWIQFYLDHS